MNIRRAQAFLVFFHNKEVYRQDRAVFLDHDRATKYAADHRGSIVPLQEQIEVTIKQCSDHKKWYADKIGKSFTVLAVDACGVWTRGDDGFINVISVEDLA
jgi:hypothetical protein